MAPSSGSFFTFYIWLSITFDFSITVFGGVVPDDRSSLIGIRYFYHPTIYIPTTPHFTVSKISLKPLQPQNLPHDVFATVMVYSGDGEQGEVLTSAYITPTVPFLNPTSVMQLEEKNPSQGIISIATEYPDTLSEFDDSVNLEENSDLRRPSLHYFGPSSNIVLEKSFEFANKLSLSIEATVSKEISTFVNFESSTISNLQSIYLNSLNSAGTHHMTSPTIFSSSYAEANYLEQFVTNEFLENHIKMDNSNSYDQNITKEKIQSTLIMPSILTIDSIISGDISLNLVDQIHFYDSNSPETYAQLSSMLIDQSLTYSYLKGPFVTQSFVSDSFLPDSFLISSFSDVSTTLPYLEDIPVGIKITTTREWSMLPMVTKNILIYNYSEKLTKQVPKELTFSNSKNTLSYNSDSLPSFSYEYVSSIYTSLLNQRIQFTEHLIMDKQSKMFKTTYASTDSKESDMILASFEGSFSTSVTFPSASPLLTHLFTSKDYFTEQILYPDKSSLPMSVQSMITDFFLLDPEGSSSLMKDYDSELLFSEFTDNSSNGELVHASGYSTYETMLDIIHSFPSFLNISVSIESNKSLTHTQLPASSNIVVLSSDIVSIVQTDIKSTELLLETFSVSQNIFPTSETTLYETAFFTSSFFPSFDLIVSDAYSSVPVFIPKSNASHLSNQVLVTQTLIDMTNVNSKLSSIEEFSFLLEVSLNGITEIKETLSISDISSVSLLSFENTFDEFDLFYTSSAANIFDEIESFYNFRNNNSDKLNTLSRSTVDSLSTSTIKSNDFALTSSVMKSSFSTSPETFLILEQSFYLDSPLNQHKALTSFMTFYSLMTPLQSVLTFSVSDQSYSQFLESSIITSYNIQETALSEYFSEEVSTSLLSISELHTSFKDLIVSQFATSMLSEEELFLFATSLTFRDETSHNFSKLILSPFTESFESLVSMINLDSSDSVFLFKSSSMRSSTFSDTSIPFTTSALLESKETFNNTLFTSDFFDKTPELNLEQIPTSIISTSIAMDYDTFLVSDISVTMSFTASEIYSSVVTSINTSSEIIKLSPSIQKEIFIDFANVTMIVFSANNVNESVIPKWCWIKTVIKARPEEVNVNNTNFSHHMESRLVLAYRDLFTRKKQMELGTYKPLRRRKRAVRADNVTVQMLFVNRTEGSNDINLIYAVNVNDSWVPSAAAKVDMDEYMDIQELALWLGYVISAKAEEYNKVEQVSVADQSVPSRYWIIGLVVGLLLLFLLLFLIVFLIYNKLYHHKHSQGSQHGDSIVSPSLSKDFNIGHLDLTYTEDIDDHKLEASSFCGSTFQRPNHKPTHQILEEVLSKSSGIPLKPPRTEYVEQEIYESRSEETDESSENISLHKTKNLHRKSNKLLKTGSRSKQTRESLKSPTAYSQTDDDSDITLAGELFEHVPAGSTPFERGWHVHPPDNGLSTGFLPRLSSGQPTQPLETEPILQEEKIPRAYLSSSSAKNFETFPQQFAGSQYPDHSHLESDDSDQPNQLEFNHQRAQQLLDNAFLLAKLSRADASVPPDQPVGIWTSDVDITPSSRYNAIRVSHDGRHGPVFIQGPSSAPTDHFWSPYKAEDESAKIAAALLKKPVGDISAPNFAEAPPPYSQHRTKQDISVHHLFPPRHNPPPEFIKIAHEVNGQSSLLTQGRTLSSPDILPPNTGCQIPRAAFMPNKYHSGMQISKRSYPEAHYMRPRSHPEDADELDITRTIRAASNEGFKPVVQAIKEELVRMKMRPEWSQGARF